jgi:hypothetical protein
LWDGAAYNVASQNGYVDGQDGDTVQVLWPPSTEFIAGLGIGENPYHYIEVVIHSTFDTYFAQVLGIDTMQNRVSAVVRLKDTKIEGMYDGSSVVSLAPKDCRAFEIDGAAQVYLVGGGMMVNSSCSANCPNGALQITNSPKAIIETPGIVLTDGSSACGMDVLDPSTIVDADGKPWKYPVLEYILPEPNCGPDVTDTGWDSANKTLSPGTYTQFPPQGTGKDITLISGTYCITEGMAINSTDAWKTEPHESESDGKGILLYFLPCSGNICDVTINGNSDTYLEAATNPLYTDYPGLLMYFATDPNCDPVDEGDGCRTVTINGDGGLELIGTILGPDSSIRISGNSGGANDFTIESQIIGYDVTSPAPRM